MFATTRLFVVRRRCAWKICKDNAFVFVVGIDVMEVAE